MRIQNSLLAPLERRLLDWICIRLPEAVKPNGLTALGCAGALLVPLCDAMSRWRPAFLLVAAMGLVIYWIGDSLDGSLARFRGIERPRFGFFLDHSVDALSNAAVMVGLGLTAFVRLDVALLALVPYLLMTIHALLTEKTLGVFRISYNKVGPTELRLVLIIGHLAMYFFGCAAVTISGHKVGIYNIMLAVGAAAIAFVFVERTVAVLKTLDALDPYAKSLSGMFNRWPTDR